MRARLLTHNGLPGPYIAAWSAEALTTPRVVQQVHRGVLGIGYPIEQMADRDENGVLWARQEWAPGRGRPEYDSIHTLRQRQAIRHLLCQVCGGSTRLNKHNDRIWLLAARTGPIRESEVTTSPPVCLQCARASLDSCPELRHGAVAATARLAPAWGVAGIRYERQGMTVKRVADELQLVRADDISLMWTVAHRLAVALHGITPVSLAQLRTGDPVHT